MKDFVYSMAPKLFLPVCHKKLKGASVYTHFRLKKRL